MEQSTTDFDVVILGGALAGSAMGMLLKRHRPQSRVLIIEKSTQFDRKVGEATVEVSGYFLDQVLEQREHLDREHLPKHGLRFWFSDRADRSLHEMSEVGPMSQARLPSFLIDRQKFDEHLLEESRASGCEVWRPAKAKAVKLHWPEPSQVIVEDSNGERSVQARWIVDATGRQAFLARKLKIQQPVTTHPVASTWARWDGVADLDSPLNGVGQETVSLPNNLNVARTTATNHFCGYGWWCWFITLPEGQTSIGLVYHKDLFQWDSQGTQQERYEYFLRSQPGLRQLLAKATPVEGDFKALQRLPYRTERYMDKGWALISDAAGFLDPYYSPGLDHTSMSVTATLKILLRDLSGPLPDDQLEAAIEAHNDRFLRSFPRWLESLYTGKYELFGDAELTATSFLVDTALYYLGIVGPVYRRKSALAEPSFGLPILPTFLAYRFMTFFKSRLIHLAHQRQKRGHYGERNAHWRLYAKPFNLGPAALRALLRGFALWGRLEAKEMWGRIRDGG